MHTDVPNSPVTSGASTCRATLTCYCIAGTNTVCNAGVKDSETGLAAPSQWDLVSDRQMMQEEQPLQVARCTKIINAGQEDAKYMINLRQIAKFVVKLGDKMAPTDIEEGMRVGVERQKYSIQVSIHAEPPSP